MAQWLTANVIQRVDWNDHLFSLHISCDDFPDYVAGQFTKFGLMQEEKIISRPYSLVSHPTDSHLEVLAVPVEEGLLSPNLHQLSQGDNIQVMAPATGFLTLDEVPASDTLWLLATGTGVGPFISILRGQEVWQKYKNVVLVYAARYQSDLAYSEEIQTLQQNFSTQFYYVPIVSREPSTTALQGRIPQLLQESKIQETAQLALNADSSQVMLCGNPDMIQQAVDVLIGLGLSKHLRRSPGQISMERYW